MTPLQLAIIQQTSKESIIIKLCKQECTREYTRPKSYRLISLLSIRKYYKGGTSCQD